MGQSRQQQLRVTGHEFKTTGSAATKQSAKTETTIRGYEQKIKTMQNEYENKLKKKDAQLKKVQDEYENKLKKKDAQLKKVQDDLADANRVIKKMNNTVKKLRVKLGQQRSSADILSGKVRALNKETKRLAKNKEKLEKIIHEQDKRLNVHENPHVPPSKQNHLHRDGVEKKKGNGKGKNKGNGKGKNKGNGKGKNASGKDGQQNGTRRGGIKNHAGKTQIFKPTRTSRHTADKCPDCGSQNVRDLKKDLKRRIVSIPEVTPHTVTLHKTARYCCLECKNKFSAENQLPAKGQFDFSVITYVVYSYSNRMTSQTIADNLDALFGLHITSQTVEKIYERGIEMLKPTRDKYAREMEKSTVVIADETTFGGEPGRWIAAYRNEDTVVFVHARKRNVRDLLSQMKNCTGIPVRDGYVGYNSLFKDRSIQQRCTQHLTREAENVARRTKLKTAKILSCEIWLMFIMLRAWTKGDHSEEERKDLVSKLEKWMRHIISRYRKSSNEMLKKCGNTFANALKHTFTFVLYPFVPSTTNLVEQSMRKVIAHRNNRIQLKSDSGADKLCILLTCVETWKLRKLNVWKELGKRICSSPQV